MAAPLVVGATVAVGVTVGPAVDVVVGTAVGLTVGLTVGFAVGLAVGFAVGLIVGFAVGFLIGCFVGFLVGFGLGLWLGCVADVGLTDSANAAARVVAMASGCGPERVRAKAPATAAADSAVSVMWRRFMLTSIRSRWIRDDKTLTTAIANFARLDPFHSTNGWFGPRPSRLDDWPKRGT